jgi:hypothetical protein
MSTSTLFRSAILSLPGSSAYYGARVFAKTAPADTIAGDVWIVIDRLSARRLAAHDGDGRMSETLFQVTVGGGSRERVEEVKDFLLEQLNGFQYEDAGGSIAILLSDEGDDYDPDKRVFASHMDFTVIDNN